jgi:hypothetical protein
MVVDDRLPNALVNRDVIEPLEWETRVDTGTSLRHRPDDMRRSVGVPQRSGNRNNTLPVQRRFSFIIFAKLGKVGRPNANSLISSIPVHEDF